MKRARKGKNYGGENSNAGGGKRERTGVEGRWEGERGCGQTFARGELTSSDRKSVVVRKLGVSDRKVAFVRLGKGMQRWDRVKPSEKKEKRGHNALTGKGQGETP